MTHVITRACAHYPAPGVDDLARAEAREALTLLTKRELAMFALSLLAEVSTPALCGLMGFISGQVKEREVPLQSAAIHGH